LQDKEEHNCQRKCSSFGCLELLFYQLLEICKKRDAVRGVSLKRDTTILFLFHVCLFLQHLSWNCIVWAHSCFCNCFVNTPKNMAYDGNRTEKVRMNLINGALYCGQFGPDLHYIHIKLSNC
jgi:hypothetical protein